METLFKNLAELFKLKSLITLALTGCFVYLAVRSNLQLAPELFASIVTAVFTYYFTRKTNAAS